MLKMTPHFSRLTLHPLCLTLYALRLTLHASHLTPYAHEPDKPNQPDRPDMSNVKTRPLILIFQKKHLVGKKVVGDTNEVTK